MVAGDLVEHRVSDPVVGGARERCSSARRPVAPRKPTIACEDVGTFELKGKAGLVPLWRALRLVAGVRGTLKAQGLEAPFVGRDRELRMAKDLYHASTDEKKAHLLSVIGIARHRQVPAGLGVLQVLRRAGRRRGSGTVAAVWRMAKE